MALDGLGSYGNSSRKNIHAWRGIHIGHKPWWMVELPMNPTVGLRLHDFNNDVKDKIGATSNTLHSEPLFFCMLRKPYYLNSVTQIIEDLQYFTLN